MKQKQPVYIVDIIGDAVDEINEVLQPQIKVRYIYGRQSQILQTLQNLTNSGSYTNTKYPMLALFQDFPERRGLGYYADLVIPKIIICQFTEKDDLPPDRYTKTFKPVLYPIYYEFLHQLALHPNTTVEDEDFIPHEKWDRLGTLPMGESLNDFVDAIEINNLSLVISQIKTC